MLVSLYNLFVLYGILITEANSHNISFRKTKSKDKSVNIALETVVEFDKNDKAADLKLLDNVKSFIGKVKTVINKNKVKQDEFVKRTNHRFTDFVRRGMEILHKFPDDELEVLYDIIKDECKNNYNGESKFSDLIENRNLRRFLAKKLDVADNVPAAIIRNKLRVLVDKIEEEKYDEKERDFISYVNSIYNEKTLHEFKTFLKDIELIRQNKKDADLENTVRDGIKFIIFDHYKTLDNNVKAELKSKIDEFYDKYIKANSLKARARDNDYKAKNKNSIPKLKENLASINLRAKSNDEVQTHRHKFKNTHGFNYPITITRKTTSHQWKKLTFLTLYPEFVTDRQMPIFRANKQTSLEELPFWRAQDDSPEVNETETLEIEDSNINETKSSHNAFIEIHTLKPHVPLKIVSSKESKQGRNSKQTETHSKHTRKTTQKRTYKPIGRLTDDVSKKIEEKIARLYANMKSSKPRINPNEELERVTSTSTKRYKLLNRRTNRLETPKAVKREQPIEKNVLTRIQDLESELRNVKTQIKNDTEIIKDLKEQVQKAHNRRAQIQDEPEIHKNYENDNIFIEDFDFHANIDVTDDRKHKHDIKYDRNRADITKASHIKKDNRHQHHTNKNKISLNIVRRPAKTTYRSHNHVVYKSDIKSKDMPINYFEKKNDFDRNKIHKGVDRKPNYGSETRTRFNLKINRMEKHKLSLSKGSYDKDYRIYVQKETDRKQPIHHGMFKVELKAHQPRLNKGHKSKSFSDKFKANSQRIHYMGQGVGKAHELTMHGTDLNKRNTTYHSENEMAMKYMRNKTESEDKLLKKQNTRNDSRDSSRYKMSQEKKDFDRDLFTLEPKTQSTTKKISRLVSSFYSDSHKGMFKIAKSVYDSDRRDNNNDFDQFVINREAQDIDDGITTTTYKPVKNRLVEQAKKYILTKEKEHTPGISQEQIEKEHRYHIDRQTTTESEKNYEFKKYNFNKEALDKAATNDDEYTKNKYNYDTYNTDKTLLNKESENVYNYDDILKKYTKPDNEEEKNLNYRNEKYYTDTESSKKYSENLKKLQEVLANERNNDSFGKDVQQQNYENQNNYDIKETSRENKYDSERETRNKKMSSLDEIYAKYTDNINILGSDGEDKLLREIENKYRTDRKTFKNEDKINDFYESIFKKGGLNQNDMDKDIFSKNIIEPFYRSKLQNNNEEKYVSSVNTLSSHTGSDKTLDTNDQKKHNESHKIKERKNSQKFKRTGEHMNHVRDSTKRENYKNHFSLHTIPVNTERNRNGRYKHNEEKNKYGSKRNPTKTFLGEMRKRHQLSFSQHNGRKHNTGKNEVINHKIKNIDIKQDSDKEISTTIKNKGYDKQFDKENNKIHETFTKSNTENVLKKDNRTEYDSGKEVDNIKENEITYKPYRKVLTKLSTDKIISVKNIENKNNQELMPIHEQNVSTTYAPDGELYTALVKKEETRRFDSDKLDSRKSIKVKLNHEEEKIENQYETGPHNGIKSNTVEASLRTKPSSDEDALSAITENSSSNRRSKSKGKIESGILNKSKAKFNYKLNHKSHQSNNKMESDLDREPIVKSIENINAEKGNDYEFQHNNNNNDDLNKDILEKYGDKSSLKTGNSEEHNVEMFPVNLRNDENKLNNNYDSEKENKYETDANTTIQYKENLEDANKQLFSKEENNQIELKQDIEYKLNSHDLSKNNNETSALAKNTEYNKTNNKIHNDEENNYKYISDRETFEQDPREIYDTDTVFEKDNKNASEKDHFIGDFVSNNDSDIIISETIRNLNNKDVINKESLGENVNDNSLIKNKSHNKIKDAANRNNSKEVQSTQYIPYWSNEESKLKDQKYDSDTEQLLKRYADKYDMDGEEIRSTKNYDNTDTNMNTKANEERQHVVIIENSLPRKVNDDRGSNEDTNIYRSGNVMKRNVSSHDFIRHKPDLNPKYNTKEREIANEARNNTKDTYTSNVETPKDISIENKKEIDVTTKETNTDLYENRQERTINDENIVNKTLDDMKQLTSDTNIRDIADAIAELKNDDALDEVTDQNIDLSSITVPVVKSPNGHSIVKSKNNVDEKELNDLTEGKQDLVETSESNRNQDENKEALANDMNDGQLIIDSNEGSPSTSTGSTKHQPTASIKTDQLIANNKLKNIGRAGKIDMDAHPQSVQNKVTVKTLKNEIKPNKLGKLVNKEQVKNATHGTVQRLMETRVNGSMVKANTSQSGKSKSQANVNKEKTNLLHTTPEICNNSTLNESASNDNVKKDILGIQAAKANKRLRNSPFGRDFEYEGFGSDLDTVRLSKFKDNDEIRNKLLHKAYRRFNDVYASGKDLEKSITNMFENESKPALQEINLSNEIQIARNGGQSKVHDGQMRGPPHPSFIADQSKKDLIESSTLYIDRDKIKKDFEGSQAGKDMERLRMNPFAKDFGYDDFDALELAKYTPGDTTTEKIIPETLRRIADVNKKDKADNKKKEDVNEMTDQPDMIPDALDLRLEEAWEKINHSSLFSGDSLKDKMPAIQTDLTSMFPTIPSETEASTMLAASRRMFAPRAPAKSEKIAESTIDTSTQAMMTLFPQPKPYFEDQFDYPYPTENTLSPTSNPFRSTDFNDDPFNPRNLLKYDYEPPAAENPMFIRLTSPNIRVPPAGSNDYLGEIPGINSVEAMNNKIRGRMNLSKRKYVRTTVDFDTVMKKVGPMRGNRSSLLHEELDQRMAALPARRSMFMNRKVENYGDISGDIREDPLLKDMERDLEI